MIGISKMSDARIRSRCNRIVLMGIVISVEHNERQEITGLILETRDAGNRSVRLAKTLYDELPGEAEASLPGLLAKGKGIRVTTYSCAAAPETTEADEIRALRVTPVVVPGAEPNDLTDVSYSDLQRHVGETVTMRGVFSLRGKVGPFILVGGRPIYLESLRSFSWGEPYARMEGKEVRVTGTLRFIHYPEVPPSKASPVARATDHFYFEAETVKVDLIEP